MKSSLLLISLSGLFCLSLLGCGTTLRSYGKATSNFPNTWSQENLAIGVHRARPKNRSRKRLPKPTRSSKSSQDPSFISKSRRTSSTQTQSSQLVDLTHLPKSIAHDQKQVGRLAVLSLDNRSQGKIKKDEMLFLVDEIRRIASYLPHSHFLVMTRESMEVLLDPSKTIEDCVGTCEVDTGRLIGADWIITGSLFKFGSGMRVSLKLFSTEEGQLLNSVSLKATTPEELEESLQRETLRLIVSLSPYLKQSLIQRAGSNLDKQLQYLKQGGQL